MFKRLPAFAPRDDLLDGLARSMVEDQSVPDDTHLNTSPRLFAGFTFVGQFIDRIALRGKHVGLPSGQQVAREMRANVLSNPVLGVSSDPGWGGEAPLWFYILKEAELPPYNAERLGPVGGRIVAEVLVGLAQRDPNSNLYLDPAWKPAPPLAPTTGQFTFVDLLRYAGAA